MNIGDIKQQLVRLKRADDLTIQLSEKIRDWSEKNLDSEIIIRKDGKSWYLKLIVKEEPPLDEWSMLFSEVIGHLRSSLDNFIYSVLTPLEDSELPLNSKQIKFPIVMNEGKWTNATKAIEHLPEIYRSRIYDMQPFARSKDGGSKLEDGLKVLQKFSNEDKHELQVTPDIDTKDFLHTYTIEFASREDAVNSKPFKLDVAKPVFENGFRLVEQKTRGRIVSVSGELRIESQVIIVIDDLQVGIIQILTELWKNTAEVLFYVAGLPPEELEKWANSL